MGRWITLLAGLALYGSYALWLWFCILRSLMDGVVNARGSIVRRKTHPKTYRFAIVIQSILALAATFLTVRSVVRFMNP